MWPPPLFADRSRAMQIVNAGVLPMVFGAFNGFLLGASGLAFQIVMALGAVGGIGAGFEHVGARGGLVRGIAGGVLFAVALVATHALLGVPARAHLPAALPAMAVFYAIMGAPFGALGGFLRGRRAEA